MLRVEEASTMTSAVATKRRPPRAGKGKTALPETQRRHLKKATLITALALEGHSRKEIAEILDTTVAHVNYTLYKARKAGKLNETIATVLKVK